MKREEANILKIYIQEPHSPDEPRNISFRIAAFAEDNTIAPGVIIRSNHCN